MKWRRNVHRRAQEDNPNTGPDISAYQAAYRARLARLTAARESTSLIYETQAEPITAYKLAYAKLDELGVARFKSLWTVGSYKAEAGRASCHQDLFNPHGAVPDLKCTCGWYGWKNKADAVNRVKAVRGYRLVADSSYPGYIMAVLTVELYGTVIEAERGYRASKMRVMAVEAYQNPAVCEWPECDQLATMKCGWILDRPIGKFCSEHSPTWWQIPQAKNKTGREPNAQIDWEWK